MAPPVVVAVLPLNCEFVMVKVAPSEYIAPPRLAELAAKRELTTCREPVRC